LNRLGDGGVAHRLVLGAKGSRRVQLPGAMDALQNGVGFQANLELVDVLVRFAPVIGQAIDERVARRAEAFLAGRMPKKLYSASASSPTSGVIAPSKAA